VCCVPSALFLRGHFGDRGVRFGTFFGDPALNEDASATGSDTRARARRRLGPNLPELKSL